MLRDLLAVHLSVMAAVPVVTALVPGLTNALVVVALAVIPVAAVTAGPALMDMRALAAAAGVVRLTAMDIAITVVA